MSTPDLPPAAAGPKDITAARRLGRYAGRRAMDPSACPYDPGSPHPAHKVLASAWMRGYLAARPPGPGQVDYSGDT